jgi:hypothetical protein
VVSSEEGNVLNMLKHIIQKTSAPPIPLHFWIHIIPTMHHSQYILKGCHTIRLLAKSCGMATSEHSQQDVGHIQHTSLSETSNGDIHPPLPTTNMNNFYLLVFLQTHVDKLYQT